MDREEYLFEKAMNRIDVKFIEEPVLRKGRKNAVITEKKTFNPKTGWILLAAAMVVGLFVGGMILRKSGHFNPEPSAEPGVEPTELVETEETEALSAEERILLLVAEKKGAPVSDGQIHYSVNGYYAADFAPYYGGTYINSEGKRVVCIALSAGEEAVRKGEERLKDNCDQYEAVKYCYSDLINVMSDLLNYYHSERYAAQAFQITKFEINPAGNTVQVSVTSIEESALDEIRAHIRIPEALEFTLTNETGIPKEPNAPAYYGIRPCQRDLEADEFVRMKADEMLEAVVADPAVYHAEDRNLDDLYILAPFKLWQETEAGLMELEEFIQYPVASNGRVICTIIVTRAGGEFHYNVSDMYVLELNQVCCDNRNRVLVFDEEAFEKGDHEKAIRLVFLPDDDGSQHPSEDNVFLDLSGEYHD
jgi:hypothetical protein